MIIQYEYANQHKVCLTVSILNITNSLGKRSASICFRIVIYVKLLILLVIWCSTTVVTAVRWCVASARSTDGYCQLKDPASYEFVAHATNSCAPSKRLIKLKSHLLSTLPSIPPHPSITLLNACLFSLPRVSSAIFELTETLKALKRTEHTLAKNRTQTVFNLICNYSTIKQVV